VKVADRRKVGVANHSGVIAAAALSSVLGVSGCGQQATVVLRDGRSVTGRIVEKRDRILVVENDDVGRVGIAEASVAEIEHPGTGAMITGGVLLGVGSLFLLGAAATDCSGCEIVRASGFVMGGELGVSGLGVGVYGLAVHEASKSRAPAPYEAPQPTRIPSVDWPGFEGPRHY